MKRKNSNMRNKWDKISKIPFILFVLLNFSIYRNALIVEGNYAIKEQQSLLLENGETGTVLDIYDDIAYLLTQNTSQDYRDPYNLFLVDIQEPTNPIRLGRIEIATREIIVGLEVKNNIVFLLKGYYVDTNNWSVTLFNITDPLNPVQLGSTAVENATNPNYNIWGFAVHNNYSYVSTDSSLEIFDCSNLTSPVKVANHTSLLGGKIHITNNYLYLTLRGVKIYDLTDQINPPLLGEVNDTSYSLAGSGVFGSYVVRVLGHYGLQVINCTDPLNPTICGHYAFPHREFSPGGQIHDMTIVGDKLFAGGRKLNVFDLSNLQDLERIARKNIGKRDINLISASDNYIYVTFQGNIKTYLFIESFLGRNIGLGLGIGFGIPLVVVGSLLIRRKKERS